MTDVVIRNAQAVEDALVWGPAMRKLSPQRQRFVLALISDPADNGTRAAIEAGYSKEPGSAKSIASRLRHDPDVLAAIHETALASLHSLKIMAVGTCEEVMRSPLAAPRDRLRAAAMVMDRTGMPAVTEQSVTVEHKVSERDKLADILRLAHQLGQEPRKLLGDGYWRKAVDYGLVIDAEFTEVLPPVAGLEDVT